MREILFRGKRVDKGERVYGYYMPRPNLGEYYIVTVGKSIWHKVIPETVGQYTGLTDKNGQKIFEGDILRVMYKNCYGNDICHTVTLYDMTDRLDVERISESEVVIIGNIHDNPELLEGAQ